MSIILANLRKNELYTRLTGLHFLEIVSRAVQITIKLQKKKNLSSTSAIVNGSNPSADTRHFTNNADHKVALLNRTLLAVLVILHAY